MAQAAGPPARRSSRKQGQASADCRLIDGTDVELRDGIALTLPCDVELVVDIRTCRCGRSVGRSYSEDGCRVRAAGCSSADPLDGGPAPDGARDFGRLVHRLQQRSKLTGAGIRADLDRIADARGLPGRGVEPARRGHANPVQVNARSRGFPVEVIEDAPGRRKMKQVPAGEIGFYRNPAWGPPVREADGSAHARAGGPVSSRSAAETIGVSRVRLDDVPAGSGTAGTGLYAVSVGTLTFLFTDIEGSTALLRRLGKASTRRYSPVTTW
jgi:hypothetical protein